MSWSGDFQALAHNGPVRRQGRHALELSRRGFDRITVFDYSKCLLSKGQIKAAGENLPVAFVRGDARSTGFRNGSFDFVMLMGSSFGYFTQDNENLKILDEAFRLLTQEGSILLDLPDKDYVIKSFKPSAWHQPNEHIKVLRERRLEKGVIYCREKVMAASGDIIRDNLYCMRLYTREEMQDMLHAGGFSDVRFKVDFMPREDVGDYGCMTNRMLVLAKKK